MLILVDLDIMKMVTRVGMKNHRSNYELEIFCIYCFHFVEELLIAANVEALAFVAVIEFLRAGTNAD